MKNGTSANSAPPRRLRQLATDVAGATAVEFSLIFSVLVLLTFGIIDFSYAMFQWVVAEKATHFGVRIAVVATPVGQDVATWTCGGGSVGPGMPCSTSGAAGSSTTCVSTGASSGTCDGQGGAWNETTFSAIVQRMQGVFPRITRDNVVVRYEDNYGNGVRLGFAGRPMPVPMVSVSLQNMTYDFLVLDELMGLVGGALPGGIPMPPFTATLPAEDLSTTFAGSVWEQG
jgi:Flp pilus assembly protein TadG